MKNLTIKLTEKKHLVALDWAKNSFMEKTNAGVIKRLIIDYPKLKKQHDKYLVRIEHLEQALNRELELKKEFSTSLSNYIEYKN